MTAGLGAGFGETEQLRVATVEVFRTERLEPVPRGELLAIKTEALFEVVEQLVDEHGGRRFAVVARAQADVAEVQSLTGGEQNLQEEIAIIFAGRAVTEAWTPGQEVEAGLWRGPGKGRVIQPNDADDFEGHAAHRLQAAEGDAPGEKAGLTEAGFERRTELLKHGGQRQFDVAARVGSMIAQGGEFGADGLQLAFGRIVVEEKFIKHAHEHACPFGGGPWLFE